MLNEETIKRVIKDAIHRYADAYLFDPGVEGVELILRAKMAACKDILDKLTEAIDDEDYKIMLKRDNE